MQTWSLEIGDDPNAYTGKVGTVLPTEVGDPAWVVEDDCEIAECVCKATVDINKVVAVGRILSAFVAFAHNRGSHGGTLSLVMA